MPLKLNLQRFASPVTQTITIILNGVETGVAFDGSILEWGANYTSLTEAGLPTSYSISDNKVVWNDGTILQYNGVDVSPDVNVIENGQYTTRANTSSGSSHKLTVENETILITVNGISVTSPYTLQNNDKIVLTHGASYLIVNGTSYTTSGQTISLSDTDINVEVGSRIPGGFSITINYTETSTPTYKFKHWKKSNVVVNRTLVGQKYYYFKPYTILGLYRIDTTLTNCTGASANATKIQENGGLTLTFTANSGYELPTGASVTNVTSYNWNKSTGVLAISKPTGDVAIEIVAVSALPQLSTPTNVAVTDTILTFDEVANATSYEVFVDDVSIGTHTIASGETYRTIKFNNAPTGDLLTWLNANGTKQ